MKNKTFIILMFFSSVLITSLLAGCSSNRNGYYINKKEKIAIKFPNDWKVMDELFGSVVRAEPSNNLDLVGITIEAHLKDSSANIDLEQFFQRREKNVSQIYKGYEKGEEGYTTINNRKTKWFIYSFGRDRKNTMVMNYILEYKDKFYVVGILSPHDCFPEYRKTFENVVKTFTFI